MFFWFLFHRYFRGLHLKFYHNRNVFNRLLLKFSDVSELSFKVSYIIRKRVNIYLKYGLYGLGSIISMMAIGVALAYMSTQPNNSPAAMLTGGNSQTSSGTISTSELAQKNGLNGNDCYVAIDGTVYLVKGFASWEMGRHTPADGSVTCGKDLTQALQELPHGAKVLRKLPKVGTLQN